MLDQENSEQTDYYRLEFIKRRREIFVIFLVAFLFISLTWFEIHLFSLSEQLPFIYAIFFFGLVNFNIILLLLLLFLIFRNIVKVFVEKRSRVFGSSLKSKLVAAFVAFSTVPTVLLLMTSVFYINSSFDKWFSVKMVSVLKSSLEVTNAYYFNARKKNYHFASQVANQIEKMNSRKEIQRNLEKFRSLYSLDALEYYPSLFGQRDVFVSEDDSIPLVPRVSLEFLQKGIRSQVDASSIYQFGGGNLVRVIVPIKEGSDRGAIVVSSFVPLSLTSKMNDISSAYDEFRDINPLEYPLKSIYLIILILMTLVILLAATWFGFYLAKQLSIPLVQLGKATKRIAGGDYTPVVVRSGSEEVSSLVESFNQMTVNLATSQKELKEVNSNLKETLTNLDRHNRYIEVVLASVSAGVISVDQAGKITTINLRAGQLLKVDPQKYINRSVRELLTLEYLKVFVDLLKQMNSHKSESIQKEFKVTVQGEVIPLQMTLSLLKNETGAEIGKILVFDDMTALVNAQRAQAWTEVARRIAHEIKNPLTPIKLSAERLQRKFGAQIQDQAFKDCTSMIINQTEDIKTLVNEFSQFARMPQTRPLLGHIHKIIEEALLLFKSSHSQILFEFNPDPNLNSFLFDPDQMKRVFVNLIDNAVAAVESEPEGERKVILTTNYDSELKMLKISIIDNGMGMTKKLMARIFEPYFSTKKEGTGLGLAIVKRIIEDHSGYIRAYPNLPKGTEMTIEIPVNEAMSKASYS